MATWSMRSMILHMARPALPGRRHSGRRGAALVEFVIVFPVLLMLVFGIWEFGRIFGTWMVVTNAAREGARYAVATNRDDVAQFQTQQYLRNALGGRLKSVDPGGDVEANVEIEPGAGQVRVMVAANVDIWAPAVSPLMSDSGAFTVTAWSTMRR